MFCAQRLICEVFRENATLVETTANELHGNELNDKLHRPSNGKFNLELRR